MNGRIEELDALRGIAAMAVVLFHFTTHFQLTVGFERPPIFDVPWGLYGVNLFFVVSGFVIFMTVRRCERTVDFAISRFTRLYPAYWCGVLLTTAVLSITSNAIAPLAFVANLSMLQELVGIAHVDPVYWTLTCELLFYFYMFWMLRFRLLDRIVGACGIWLALQYAAWGIEHYFGWFPWRVVFLLNLQYGALFIAGILFFLYREGDRSFQLLATLAACLPIQVLQLNLQCGIVALLVFAVFFLFVHGKLNFMRARPFVFLGTISYALYLVHERIGWVVMKRLYAEGVETHVAIVAAIGVSIALAAGVTYLVERPAARYLRKRLNWLTRDWGARAPARAN